MSRLEDIPEVALQNVVRHIRSSFSISNWKSFVDGGDALSVLRLGGSISEAARAMFTRVHVGNPNREYSAPSNTADEGTLFLGECKTDILTLTDWIEAAGESLTSLVFGFVEDIFPENCRYM